MKFFINLFLEHPRSAGKSYLTHMMFAIKIGLQLLMVGVALILHSIFPFLFQNTASLYVKNLVKRFNNENIKIKVRIKNV